MSSGRPRGISETTWLMAIFNPSGFFFVDWKADRNVVTVSVVGTLFIIVAGYIVLWFYWKGRNWARWLVMATSLIALWNLEFWPSVGWVGRITIAVEALLAVFLLYWLNTRPVRTYFAAPTAVTQE
jgi:hypothetical protein